MNLRLLRRVRRTVFTRPRQRMLALFAGIVVPLYAFGDVAEDIWLEGGHPWDQRVQALVHRYDTPTRDRLMQGLSQIGYTGGVVPLDVAVMLALLARSHRDDARFFGTCVGGSGLITLMAKRLFRRKRPAVDWHETSPLHSYSFPSGHAMRSFATVAALVVLAWPTPWRWPLIAAGVPFVALVGVSRVYLGVHYPSDVVASWSAALAWTTGTSLAAYGQIGKP